MSDERSAPEGLVKASSDFVEELKAFGYGRTSEKALPGSYDSFVKALEEAKEKIRPSGP